MKNDEKIERLNQIKQLLRPFCKQHLNDELIGYVTNLCDKLGRKRTISITSGKPDIWAAAIVYVIARLNFLFDPESPNSITPDTICEFFSTKKSTTGNKATQIENECKIQLGDAEFCSSDISDKLTFVQTPEGFIIPKSMISDKKFEIEFIDSEEAEELEAQLAEEKRRKEREAEEKRARRTEINREIAIKKQEIFE